MDLQTLKEKFNLKTVEFTEGEGGFIFIDVQNPLADARISTYGAHVTSYTPNGQRPVLWMSRMSWFESGKPIRGGVPICWPWFGAAPVEGQPSHGFARISQWEVENVRELESGETVVTLELPEAAVDPALLRFSFRLELEIIVGRSLELVLTMVNASDSPQQVTGALHSYFSVAAAEEIVVRGLSDVGYEDRVVGAPVVYGHIQKGDIGIDREVDRIYHGTGAVEIFDPGFNRVIRVEKSGSAATVVWNPWIRKSHAMPDFGDEEYHTMVCIEAANASVDARTLMPGEIHRLGQKITVL